ncbi:PQQ-binding-like beta-propeller repeat protein [Streptomyces sp. NPDC015346]|uniref:outer membrane protein assembly factor BamB family protein n=1 Tax=Streptomyces sp. NPDC015346 TaxID=3364954 RepID=UPI0036F7276B
MSQPPEPQPWYGYPRPQLPVEGNPYAQGGTGPQRPRRKGLRGGPGAVVAALVAGLLLGGGGMYAFLGGGGTTTPAKPTVQETTKPPKATASSPAASKTPDAADINARRVAGDARAWLGGNDADLPRRTVLLNDLWTVGDTIVQAVYKEVTAYKLSDGAKVWSVPLPGPVCETPVNTTPDGKVVIAYKNTPSGQGGQCDQLRMIDLKTGTAGWHKELTSTGAMDGTISLRTAITGDTVMVVQNMWAAAYRVGDGARLFVSAVDNPGDCYPDEVAGGTRLLQIDTCAVGGDASFGQVKELDPRTGKVKWRWRTQKGWAVSKVYSVDPVVVTTYDRKDSLDTWRIVALKPDGKLRSTLATKKGAFKQCADTGDSGRGAQNCPGAAVGPNTLYLGSESKLAAFDLNTGKLSWGVQAEDGRRMYPLRAEGDAVIAYGGPSSREAGRVVRIAGRGDKVTRLLRHPDSAREVEFGMFAGNLAYGNGRVVITPSVVNGDDKVQEPRMLSFGPDTP